VARSHPEVPISDGAFSCVPMPDGDGCDLTPVSQSMSWTIAAAVQALFPSRSRPASPPDVLVLSASAGRARLRIPDWKDGVQLTQQLVRLPGVRRVEASYVTGNILFLFDQTITDPRGLLDGVRELLRVPEPPPPPPPPPLEILSSSPGRLRVRLTGWTEAQLADLEQPLRRLPGIGRLDVNPVTGNILLWFDPVQTTADDLLARLRAWSPGATGLKGRSSCTQRSARISVRGLDRQPQLARQLIQTLQTRHGVRASFKGITGHLVVSYDHQRVLLEEVLAEIAHLEMPELPGEDKPSHPLDPEPLVEGLTRAIGTLLGMA
jgi:hypothetical protein